ncbi:MAG TPA: CbiX/SirB N-terminal domain-containing protein [Kofleriaceae bacterium]|nr:CbiX/SirB N-terminal domain-containing protein [Kofleriaceae bacterium]
MGPLFAITVDLAPHDAAWSRAVAQAAAVADAASPILGFRPDVVVASLELDGGAADSLAAVLADHAARGGTLAFIVPAILDFSIFQRQVIGEIARESQRRAPALAIHHDDVDPCHPRLVQALAESLWQLLAGGELAPARLGVVVVASGQGDARARAGAYAVMRLLWEQLAVAAGEVAFVRHPRPAVPEVLARCLATPLHWIAVPLMLWPGAIHAYAEVLFDDVRRAHPEAIGLALAAAIGDSPHVRAWLVERMLALFRAHRDRRAARTPSLVHAASARESCVIGPEASCTMDILPVPLGPDLAYGAGVIAEIVDTVGLARLLEHFELRAGPVFVKVTWHGYATGTYTDAAALDQLLSALPGRAIVLEGHSTGRNTGGASFDWDSEARAHRGWLRDQEAEFLRRTGIADVLARHRAQYVNITEAYWDGACAPREAVVAMLDERGVRLRDDELAGFVPEIVLEHCGAPLVSFARFKGPTRLAIANCFGLLPPPLRSRFHGPTIDHFARVCCDVARLYGALLPSYGLVEALHSAVRWTRDGLYRSRFGNYDLILNPGVVTLSRGLVAADVLASRLQGQDVGRSAFFAAVFDELGGADRAADAAIPDELVQRFA